MQPLAPRPQVPIGFAHRGARAERRENTIDAFVRALDLGATGLESDAWLTADGEVVLAHDGVTGPPWRRHAISAQARAGLPAHIPTLAELYATCGTGFELSVDVKDVAAFHPLLAVARAAGAAGRLWLCHPETDQLASWRGPAGDAKLVQSTRLGRISESLEARSGFLHNAGIDALNLHRSDWNPERVTTVHHARLDAFGWDAQSPASITELLQWGLDGVYSDHVDRLMGAINRFATTDRSTDSAT